jgi:hypothetical protein
MHDSINYVTLQELRDQQEEVTAEDHEKERRKSESHRFAAHNLLSLGRKRASRGGDEQIKDSISSCLDRSGAMSRTGKSKVAS